jgi:3-dehydroquinate synthase
VSATRITVGGKHPYPVVIGTGVLSELSLLVGAARTVVVVHPEGLEGIARPVCGALARAGYLVHAEAVPPGEAAKEIAVAVRLWSRLAAYGVTRSDALVGVGGGATTDLAGFVAATWLRGVRVVLVPTARTWWARFTSRPGCWATWPCSSLWPRWTTSAAWPR